MINFLAKKVVPVKGKKRTKKPRLEKQRRSLIQSVDSMLKHIAVLIGDAAPRNTEISLAMEKAVMAAFNHHCSRKIEKRECRTVSGRGANTYIFPWKDPEGYDELTDDAKKFKKSVCGFLAREVHATGHKPSCALRGKYRLCGFRSKPRRTITTQGRREFRIRMVECRDCKRKFSIVPSFLPREKHYCIDIIGQVFENVFRFAMSILGALQNTKLLANPVRSKQTVLNWLRQMGALHPAAVLTRAEIQGSGYFEEDEGFEKEPDLRTYSVVIVDPINLLVWHSDYVDSVDEESLVASFEKSVSKIEFKVIGIAKDGWKASTKALKTVFKNLQIGFCHRHCLKKLYQDLLIYRKETGCSLKKISALYMEIKEILKTASSKKALTIRLNALKDEAFGHPTIKKRIASIKRDAVYYTSSKRRKGISKTTSVVDNFLKVVKRKLIQAESFRDRQYTGWLFQAMANVRNFLPFLPPAKNAHKSPFMLADGKTYDLPWMQTMNVHNAFLFTKQAF